MSNYWIDFEGEIQDSLPLAGIMIRKRNIKIWDFWRLDIQMQKSVDDLYIGMIL